MNTKIISISEDQNTITHESGLVTEFTGERGSCCFCIYIDIDDVCFSVSCVPNQREDKRNGIFKLKTT